MKRSTLIALLLLPAFFFAGNPAKNKPGFRENKGQIATHGKPVSQVLFTATGGGPGIFITTSGITYVFNQKEKDKADSRTIARSKIEMVFEGANIQPANSKVEKPLAGVANFYYAHCPEGILNVKTYQMVTICNIYPGIDWVLNASEEKGLSYDLVVHPGADPSQISVVYKGASSINLSDNNTKVTLHSKYGEISERALNVFQADGKKVDAAFKVRGNELKYSLAKYDPRYELIIDPPLVWSKKEVSSGLDYANALVCPRDGSGDVIVTGFTSATDFPTLNAYQDTCAGNMDMCILRMSGNGTLLWSTYYGGTADEEGKGIGADGGGNCYVAGYTTSSNMPTLNPLAASNHGGKDVAILKFNNTGIRQWATYYGGTSDDAAYAVVCDAPGNMFITGYTSSTGFPVSGAIQGTKSIAKDGFVMKLNNACVVQWSTFYGGDDDDIGRGITLDAAGANLYVVGSTVGNFTVTAGAYQTTNASLYNVEDIFVSKMSTLNAAVQYATLCGTADVEIPEDVAVDNAGNAYVVGYTFASNYPVVNPGGGAYVDSTIGSASTHDAFITKFNATGTGVTWSTYLGGSGVDMALGACYDPIYGVYVTGSTASTDLPTQLPADNVYYQSTQGDGGVLYDAFMSWFTTAGVMQWCTYYGGANSEEGRGIDTDVQSNIFVGGTDSNNVRVTKFAAGVLTGMASLGNASASLKLYPVPAQNTLHLDLQMSKAGTVSAEILTMDGRVIRKEILQAAAGANEFTFDVGQLPSANYLLRLSDAEKVRVERFSKGL